MSTGTQRPAVARQRIAAAIDDEVPAIAVLHLRMHARDGAVRIVEHQRVVRGPADGAALRPELRGGGPRHRRALVGSH